MERRLAAIVAADVVGYSRLIRADEEGTLLALRALREEVIDPKISEHRGRIVKLMGDGILIEFASAVDAVECSAAMQQTLAEHNSGAPGIVFRVGVNLGDVVIDGDDIQGDGVNIAARLEALSEPGGMCVSDAVHEQVRDRLDLVFEDIGKQDIKNIDRPVRVWKWFSPVGKTPSLSDSAKQSSSASDKPSIAVLAFDNISGDPEREYLADGITEDIITNLSRFRDLVVIGRKSSFFYKGKDIKPTAVAQDLGVQYLVEGSLRVAGKRLRLTVQLTEPTSGAHLWAERYDREIGDLFAVQDEVVESVVQTLVGRLRSSIQLRASRMSPQDLAAYDFVLQARAIISDNQENMLRSRALYEKAIERDPECGHAYVGLAGTYAFEWTSGWSSSVDDTLTKAIGLAQKAATLDQQDGEARRRLGAVYLFRGDLEQSAEHLNRALVLNPNDADAMAYLGLYRIYNGEPVEALEELKRATRRNPYHPTWYFWFIGLAYYGARQYDNAILPLRSAVEAFPKFITPHRHLAATYAQMGNLAAAESERLHILECEPNFSIARIARTLPYQSETALDHYCEGLRKAGLPE